jgi:CRISPR system Cascade subunit CasE
MNSLHMVSLELDLRQFRRWSAGRGFTIDEGRALHHLLSETFGSGALKPFRLMTASGAKTATLYAYTQVDEAGLRQLADETGMPDALALINADRLAIKTMPEVWREGRKLAFDVRIRPVRRLLKPLEGWSRTNQDGATKSFRKGAEVDAFIVDVLRQFPNGQAAPEDQLSREGAYRAWLIDRLGNAARIETARMIRFQRSKVQRSSAVEGPDATFHGELTVLDGPAFAQTLVNGIGRHTSYGFGMLLLRPARR